MEALVKELLAGLYEEAQQETEKWAQRLAAQLAKYPRWGSPAAGTGAAPVAAAQGADEPG